MASSLGPLDMRPDFHVHGSTWHTCALHAAGLYMSVDEFLFRIAGVIDREWHVACHDTGHTIASVFLSPVVVYMACTVLCRVCDVMCAEWTGK